MALRRLDPPEDTDSADATPASRAGKPYVIRIKRTGRKRSLPPQQMQLAVTGGTRATYRCAKRT